MRLAIAICALTFAFAGPTFAAPTADDVKATLAKFATERAEALKAKFPEEALARADESAKRAEASLKAEDFRAAGRHARDARWQVPYLPPNLPAHVVRVLGESRLRHADRVNAVSYSPDGTKIVTASRDGTAKVWDLGNGREILSYRGHREASAEAKTQAGVLRVADAAYSPDGKSVASVSENEIHIWNPTTGKLITKITRSENPDKPFKSLAFSPDGESIAVGGDDQILRVYNLEAGKPTFVSPTQPGRIEAVAFAPNGKLVATVNNVGQLIVYCPGAAKEKEVALTTAVSSTGEAYDVAFTQDSSALLTAGKDNRAKLTAGPKEDGTSGGSTAQPLREYAGHTAAVHALAASKDGTTLVTGSADHTVRVWDVATGKALRSFQGHLAEVSAVAIRPDAKQVVSASDDGTIRIWELTTQDDHRALTDAADSLWSVAFSPDGKRMATAGADRTVRVYSTANGKLERSLPAQPGAITSLAFLPGDRLAAAGGDRVIHIWDVAEGKKNMELGGHESAVLALAPTADGKRLLSGSADRTVRCWDADTGKILWSVPMKSAVCSVAVRSDGKLAAVGYADGSLVMFDISGPSPKEIATTSAHLAGVSGIAFDTDGLRLATCGGDGLVRVWTVANAGTLTPLVKFEGQVKPGTTSGYSPVTAVAFSPDGRFIASCGADQIVHVWDVQTKGEARGLRAHTDWVAAVAFSPDGRYLVSAGVDRVARIFELSQQEIAPPPGHTQTVRAVAVSPDGTHAATASYDRTIKVWNIADGSETTTILGSIEKLYCISFVGTERLVTGGQLPTADSGRIQFWTVKPPKAVADTLTGQAYAITATSDGSKVAAWTSKPMGEKSNQTYELFNAAGTQIETIQDNGRDVSSVSFSPDVSWIVTGDKRGGIRILDFATKEPVRGDWPLFVQPIADLAVTSDKKTLVAVDASGTVKVADIAKRDVRGSADAHKYGHNGIAVLISPKNDTFLTVGVDSGEVKAWSMKDVKPIRTWKCPVTVWSAAYTPDGKQVVTANGDGTAYVLELP